MKGFGPEWEFDRLGSFEATPDILLGGYSNPAVCRAEIVLFTQMKPIGSLRIDRNQAAVESCIGKPGLGDSETDSQTWRGLLLLEARG